jgi:hypothetical protein
VQDLDIQVIPISKKVIKFRAISIKRGKVYERVYMGYKPTQALETFKKWLETQKG